MKEMLTSEQLIEHMKNKGITFNLCSEEEAKSFLENNNYYLKLASYRANYKKYNSGPNKGKYINLDFGHLKELSTLDMHLRYYILQMTLDIEHYLKTKLLCHIANNPHEDGYNIVRLFITKYGDKVLEDVNKHKSNDYCRDLITKYENCYPIWVFVELISFSQLAKLCSFYSSLYSTKISDSILLNSVRDLRNATAHSNCLINHLPPHNYTPSKKILARVRKIKCIGKTSRDKKMSNKFMYDLTCLIFAYNDIIPQGKAKEKRYKELHNFLYGRLCSNADWFRNNSTLSSSYDYIKKIIDNFNWII